MGYLYDFSLSVLGPEGLGRSGAADGDEAGRLTVQRGSDQLAAGCRDIKYKHRKRLQAVGFNGGVVTNPWAKGGIEYSIFELLRLDEQLLFLAMLSGWTSDNN